MAAGSSPAVRETGEGLPGLGHHSGATGPAPRQKLHDHVRPTPASECSPKASGATEGSVSCWLVWLPLSPRVPALSYGTPRTVSEVSRGVITVDSGNLMFLNERFFLSWPSRLHAVGFLWF